MKLILASQSPRRRRLLAELGLSFITLSTDIDETPCPNEAPADLAVRLAEAKAEAAAARLDPTEGALVLASDTVVALGNEILGKPTDAADARRMLEQLRGQTHLVHTAVSVRSHPHPRTETRLNSSRITMRAYTDAEIDAYIATGDPQDKAGAYAIQHPAFAPVAQLDGCYAGVMGFPLNDVRMLLCARGIKIEADIPAICRGSGSAICCCEGPQKTNLCN